MSYWTRNEWIEDAKERVLQNTKRTDDYARELIFLYDEAAFNIEKEIEALFARFAKDNGLTEEAARQLLEGTDRSVGDIAAQSGYGDPSAFYRAFRQAAGLSPEEWRRQRNSAQSAPPVKK